MGYCRVSKIEWDMLSQQAKESGIYEIVEENKNIKPIMVYKQAMQNCKNCGAPLHKWEYKCEFCGTEYS